MPFTEQEIKEFVAKGTPEELAEGLKEHANPHYSKLYSTGFAHAKNEWEEKLAAKVEEYNTLKQQLDEAKRQASQSGDQSAKIQELEDKLSALTNEKANLQQKVEETLNDAVADQFLNEALGVLTTPGADGTYVDQKYASVVMKPELRKRIKIVPQKDEHGNVIGRNVRAYDEAGQVPINATDRNQLLKLFTGNVRASVDKDFVKTSTKSGGGTGGGEGGTGKAALFDKLRKETKEQVKAKASTEKSETLLKDRFGKTG